MGQASGMAAPSSDGMTASDLACLLWPTWKWQGEKRTFWPHEKGPPESGGGRIGRRISGCLAPRMVQQRGRGSFGCWPVGRSWPVSRAPPVAGVRRPACRPALASADEDPVDWPRRLAPHRRVVGCVRRCRNLVSIPGRSAASAVQADIGHHHRRARPVPATGAPRGGVGGFVRRCGGCVGRGGGIARRGPAVGVAVSGSRPPGVVPPVQTSRPTAPPARPYYAVVRRTRRRGGTVRGAAMRAGWGRPPRGVACACCAREATSWSPAPSSSRSLMMLSRSKMARLLWPVRRMATRSGTLAPPRRPGASTPWLARQRRRAPPPLGRTAVPSRHHRAARCIGRRINGCEAAV